MKKILLTVVTACVFQMTTAVAYADCMNSDPFYWQGTRRLSSYDKLMQFMQCRDYGDKIENALSDRTACNWFVARALQALFNINDFAPEGGQGWRDANTIASEIGASSHWTKIGDASSQATLQSAADAAAAGDAVVAIEPGDTHGHVAIILAGPLTASGSWSLKVPNSASFRLDSVDKTFVGCKLSFAWQKPDGVAIFKRVK
ncbi:hypothetical protein MOV61_08120 [Neorhizobium sp. BETTINA12A]|uniref:hypothetical protein n=1 Tax=Neorhizobium sp. BETTINA12A TaxID=2908924 RepID=UPI001FF0EDF7|nr:hypothetical protein [Neorhizobium sp. BETTINA12A]MCJ9750680.1 hypothetical protein [Neorhizobium sp. BETTINA12A]